MKLKSLFLHALTAQTLVNADVLHSFEKVAVGKFDAVMCDACQVTTWGFSKVMKFPPVEWAVVNAAKIICDVGSELFTPYTHSICSGMVDNQLTEALWPMMVNELLTDQSMCTFVLEVCDMDHWKPLNVEEVVSAIIDGKPALAQSNDYVNNMYKSMQTRPKDELIKVAVFSDLHVDFDYAPGSNNDCGKPLCCRTKEGPGTSGKWGDFKCDLPVWTMKSMFEHIKDEIKPDLVMWAGDSIAHDVEEVTFDETVDHMDKVTKMV